MIWHCKNTKPRHFLPTPSTRTRRATRNFVALSAGSAVLGFAPEAVGSSLLQILVEKMQSDRQQGPPQAQRPPAVATANLDENPWVLLADTARQAMIQVVGSTESFKQRLPFIGKSGKNASEDDVDAVLAALQLDESEEKRLQELADKKERERIEYEAKIDKEITRSLEQGLQRPQREIAQHAQYVKAIHNALEKEKQRLDEQMKKPESLLSRAQKSLQAQLDTIEARARLLGQHWPADASEAEVRFKNVISGTFDEAISSVRTSSAAAWNRTTEALVNGAAFFDERRSYWKGMVKSDGPSALDITRGMDLDGKYALVTGATGGIGREVTVALATAGANVVGTASTNQHCADFMRDMKEIYQLENVNCMVCNMADPGDVLRFATRFEAKKIPIDIFVQAAGVLQPGPRREIGIKYDKSYTVNHLGHALMTELLLPRIAQSTVEGRGETRIVSVSCGAHRWADLGRDELHAAKMADLTGYTAYSVSKLGQLIYINALAERFKKWGLNATANSVNPGSFIDTPLSRRTFFHWAVTKLGARFNLTKTPSQAAAEVINVAVDPELKRVSGRYFENYYQTQPSSLVQDQAFAADFIDETASELGQLIGDHTYKTAAEIFEYVKMIKQINDREPRRVFPAPMNRMSDYWRIFNAEYRDYLRLDPKRFERKLTPAQEEALAMFHETPNFLPFWEQIVFDEKPDVRVYRKIQGAVKELKQREAAEIKARQQQQQQQQIMQQRYARQ